MASSSKKHVIIIMKVLCKWRINGAKRQRYVRPWRRVGSGGISSSTKATMRHGYIYGARTSKMRQLQGEKASSKIAGNLRAVLSAFAEISTAFLIFRAARAQTAPAPGYVVLASTWRQAIMSAARARSRPWRSWPRASEALANGPRSRQNALPATGSFMAGRIAHNCGYLAIKPSRRGRRAAERSRGTAGMSNWRLPIVPHRPNATA